MATRAAMTRVRRGARWLDENFPGWESRIDIDTLDLSDDDDCICGQVFSDSSSEGLPGFEFARLDLFGEANHWISRIVPQTASCRRDKVAIALGFDNGRLYDDPGKVDGVYVAYDELEEAWKELLARRAAEACP